MSRYILLIFFLLSLQSCFLLKNTPGFNSGEHKLTDYQKQRFSVVMELTDDTLNQNDAIKIVNGKVLRTYLQQSKDTVLVYFWSVNCSSNACLPLSSVQYYCDQRNYKLVIVAEYFDEKIFKQKWERDYPMVFIDHKYYKTNYAIKYNKLFTVDILDGASLSKENMYDRYLFFSKGRLFQTKNDLYK